jgi:hypothetical protein
MNSVFWMLAARWGEALGLQVIERPATRTFDLYFLKAAGGGQLATAMAATYVLHVIVLEMFVIVFPCPGHGVVVCIRRHSRSIARLADCSVAYSHRSRFGLVCSPTDTTFSFPVLLSR